VTRIALGIAIGIEIVWTVAIDRMLIANLGASAAETAEQGHESSIPIPIAIPIVEPTIVGAPKGLTSPPAAG